MAERLRTSLRTRVRVGLRNTQSCGRSLHIRGDRFFYAMSEMSPSPAAFVRVASIDEIPARKGKAVIVNDHPIVIFRVGNRFVAVVDRCPHAGAPLSIGTLRGEEVTCAWHGWTFNVLEGNSVPDAPGFQLTSVPLKVEGSEIFVAV